jgi:hypothetical protein
MRALPPLTLLLLCACQREPGVSVQIVAEPAVPTLDRLHLMVLQNGELLVQDRADFSLSGITLPQTVTVGSSAGSIAAVDIVVQGFVGTVVQARGEVSSALSRDKPYAQVTLVLVPLCSAGSCGQTPTTCAAQKASCGTVDDLAGGFLDCGHCTSGQTCGGGGPHRCGTSTCTPTLSCASLDAGCGYVFDGCKMAPCGTCNMPLQCTPQRSCECAPTVTCATADAGCLPIDDGCGHTLTCVTCPAGVACGPDGRCSCTPDCSAKQCGGADGCGGHCMTGGMCPGMGLACIGGVCQCPPGTITCTSSSCADVLHDPLNCGSCGHACPNGNACANGVCLCNQPLDNSDGHCCPPGYNFLYAFGTQTPYCFSAFPRSADTEDDAEFDCTFVQGHGCVGFGPVPNSAAPAPIPYNALCGSYLSGREGASGGDPFASWVETYSETSPPIDVGGQACSVLSCDGGSYCACSDCNCFTPATGCQQPYYCVNDPLGPRRDPCFSASDCPSGSFCDAGACWADPSGACCVSAYSCGGVASGKTCLPTGTGRATGVCRGN